MRGILSLILLTASLGLFVGCSAKEDAVVEDAVVEQPPTVYLVAFDDFPRGTTERLQTFFREKHGISVGVLPSLRVREDTVDPGRQQIVADRLLDDIEAARGAEHPDWVVIGLTEYDIMMEEKPEWRFVFSLRKDSARVAVVSVARMDPRSFGERPDADLLFERASKMVGKNIGVMHLGLPMSEDPASVMYNELLSLNALDMVDADFSLSSPTSGSTSRQ